MGRSRATEPHALSGEAQFRGIASWIRTFLYKSGSLCEREPAIYGLAKISMEPGGGSDEVLDRADKLLGHKGIAEVVGLPGYCSSVSMGMNLHRVPVPAYPAT